MIKAIIFDFGKVISHAPNMTIRGDIAKAFDVDEKDVDKAMSLYMEDFRIGKINEDKFWQNFSDLFSKPVPMNKYDLWRKSFSDRLVIYENMLSYVRELKKKGIKVAVVSNNIQPFVDIVRERKGFIDFDIVINSCEVGFSKPEPTIYQMALDRLMTKPNETIFVDDKEINIEAAQKLGMITVLAKNTEQIQYTLNRVLMSG